MHQFWSKGYQHTSMHDLLAAMNLSKSSLYQAFGSKRQLFRQCVGRYADQFAAQLRHGLAEAPSGWRFIEDFLHSVLRDVAGTPRGCLVMNTASELGQSEPEIARECREASAASARSYGPRWNVPSARETSRPSGMRGRWPPTWSAA